MKTLSAIIAGTALAGLIANFGCSHGGASQTAAPAPASQIVGDANTSARSQPAVTSGDESFRLKAPEAGPKPAWHAPVPVKKVLANGLTVLAVNKPGLPLVSAAVIVRSGSAQDPQGLPGVAGFTGDMIKTGTEKRKAKDIDDQAESRGASIEVNVDADAITVSTASLTDNFAPVFEILADILQHTTFDPAEIERVRKQRDDALKQSTKVPQHAASQVFRRLVYGEHPYGHLPLGDEATLKKINRKTLKDYYVKHFRPANTGVIVVGDLTTDKAIEMVEASLGKWKGAPNVQTPPRTPVEQPHEISLVAGKPNAPQSQLMIGELAVQRTDPDYFPLVICNAILGGLFNSRINMNLREDKGYTYGARSYFGFMRERGPFFVSSAVKTDVTDLAIREIVKEIERMRSSDVSAEELNNAKSRYSLSLPGAFQTVEGISGMMTNLFLYDLPLDYFQQIPDRINAVTVADVRRVSEAHLHPDKLVIVVVGDQNHVEPGLHDLQRGPVVLRDAEGKIVGGKKPGKG